MKKSLLILILCAASHIAGAQEYWFENISFGAGSFTENVGKVQVDIDGNTEKFDFNPFFRFTGQRDFYYNHKLLVEAGTSLPRGSRDSDVTRLNYWLSFLFKYNGNSFFKPHYGVGFFFTRLSMDGKPQQSYNANVATEYQTPDGAVYAGNNVVILGADMDISKEYYFNIQAMALNVEDKVERSFNYFLSLNYNFGSF